MKDRDDIGVHTLGVIPGEARGPARRGKGTQAPNTVTVVPAWVPFPRTRYRSCSPGMTTGFEILKTAG